MCHDLSVWNKRQKSHFLSKKVEPSSIIYLSEEKTHWSKQHFGTHEVKVVPQQRWTSRNVGLSQAIATDVNRQIDIYWNRLQLSYKLTHESPTLAKDLHFLLQTGILPLSKKKRVSFGRGNLFSVSALITASTVGGPRDFARVIDRIFLSLNLIGWGQKKRNDVTEIVLQLEISDTIFGGREATTGNTSAVRRLTIIQCLFGFSLWKVE